MSVKRYCHRGCQPSGCSRSQAVSPAYLLRELVLEHSAIDRNCHLLHPRVCSWLTRFSNGCLGPWRLNLAIARSGLGRLTHYLEEHLGLCPSSYPLVRNSKQCTYRVVQCPTLISIPIIRHPGYTQDPQSNLSPSPRDIWTVATPGTHLTPV